MVAKKTASAEEAAKKTTKKATTKTTAKAAGKKTATKAVARAPEEKATKKAATKAAEKAAPARNSTAKAAPAKKTTAKKATAKTAASAKKAVPAKKTGARTVALKKTPDESAGADRDTAVPKARAGAAGPGELAVRPGEEPWSAEEVAEARAELNQDAERLRGEIRASEAAVAGLMRDSGDGAGDDQADTGAKNITREHELALAGSARERLLQTERALARLDAGTYGLCESCGRPIGKARMQAFPRATLCVECKQRQERR
ncbi:TraR/DksA C4-type zinc finger protein [Streptomyces sp. XD-27]|uniref:TraR/DksA family transcriptional regulator n=1 Tax=Streptomyces sp. XD-27 TaxID=3062779 RepID=UPI0026F4757B|nr:TraR/DksA C4-type zinc finger protein [Streptomyces sp. XD-27]WKX69821.1 TraR/DksA C4-type zinc finger protein [Streptomyces sp. XD-27]